MKDFDELMTVVGSHGPYQRWLVYGVIAPISFFIGFTGNLLLFQLKVPDHWCHVPGVENTSLSPEEWKNLTIPRESGEFSSCSRYKVEWLEEGAEEPFLIHNITEDCEQGWEHDTSEFLETMATKNEWFCERKNYINHIYSLTQAGHAVGTAIFPVIADRFTGRRIMFYVALAIHAVFTFPIAWVSNYGIVYALKFFAGLAFETVNMMSYISGFEFLAPEERTTGSLVTFVAWTFGTCLTSPPGWLIPRFQYLVVISCIPAVCGFLYWRYLPESPRWLLSQGKISECATNLLLVARSNHKTEVTRMQLEADLRILWNRQEKEVSLLEVLRYPKLRVRALILLFMSACIFLSYGVVFLGVTVLSSNFFLSHFVLSLSELPSNGLGWVWTHYLGRRCTCILSFLTTAAFCVAATFCLEDKWVMLAVAACIRLFSTQLIYIATIQSAEIFPTPIRSTGFAWMVVWGMGAMIATPYILHSEYGESFPYWFLASLLLLCAFLGIFLPETIGLPLPQTFQDAEELGKGRPLMTWIHHWNQHRYMPVSFEEPDNLELKKGLNICEKEN
ncbi:solute carrier family 22 member 5-like [Penaeus monodon]|uniref:solute carrier family 22 member 5-like n=1 Tax=Penaeus monodon TaxID=6687 RepID=UPI0018A753E1|nr:solute carrier family 22 member 5-like [Penaeus monodon]